MNGIMECIFSTYYHVCRMTKQRFVQNELPYEKRRLVLYTKRSSAQWACHIVGEKIIFTTAWGRNHHVVYC